MKIEDPVSLAGDLGFDDERRSSDTGVQRSGLDNTRRYSIDRYGSPCPKVDPSMILQTYWRVVNVPCVRVLAVTVGEVRLSDTPIADVAIEVDGARQIEQSLGQRFNIFGLAG
jgi:hypothetical protein